MRLLGRAGFATATVMGLVAVVGLISAGALHDALFGEQLAGSRLLHQRALALAQHGTEDGLARLARMAAPSTQAYTLQPLPGSTDQVSVTVRHLGAATLPPGFTADRFGAQRFAIESTGHAGRGISATHVQGATRVMPVTVVPSRTLP